MDRLVVGDVGYGKTEVALRAAFKAIQDGKQVAVLVPTTVLAAQHFATFGQRFAAFPVQVRLLSRFVTQTEQKRTIGGLEDGSVDLVIGTHRLLSKDVQFRDLGLVVVDEEQRFGVAAKERLKQLRREVDVLTLSATPIPRTLNLALAGVRDMSVIETPPEDRLPIQTRVAEASAGLVRDAILRELDRGGQVFYVHNRVETIEAQTEQLRRMLPGARFVVGHGQMPEGHLESVMIKFAGGEADVLSARRSSSPARHPEREHDHHRPRRHARARPALPAARPGRALVAPGVRLPPLPAARADERGGPEAATGDLQRVGAGRRVPDRAR
jgi:transcription-repair coupling factor (superfamily II helicase)